MRVVNRCGLVVRSVVLFGWWVVGLSVGWGLPLYRAAIGAGLRIRTAAGGGGWGCRGPLRLLTTSPPF